MDGSSIPDHEKAFKGVKDLFCTQILLHYLDMTKPFFLQTDASDFALGAVLHEENPEKRIQPVSYASRTLKEAEINYFTTEKELLALVWALMKCRSYLFGFNFVIRTDYKALIFLRSCKLIGSRLSRTIISVQNFVRENTILSQTRLVEFLFIQRKELQILIKERYFYTILLEDLLLQERKYKT